MIVLESNENIFGGRGWTRFEVIILTLSPFSMDGSTHVTAGQILPYFSRDHKQKTEPIQSWDCSLSISQFRFNIERGEWQCSIPLLLIVTTCIFNTRKTVTANDHSDIKTIATSITNRTGPTTLNQLCSIILNHAITICIRPLDIICCVHIYRISSV